MMSQRSPGNAHDTQLAPVHIEPAQQGIDVQLLFGKAHGPHVVPLHCPPQQSLLKKQIPPSGWQRGTSMPIPESPIGRASPSAAPSRRASEAPPSPGEPLPLVSS